MEDPAYQSNPPPPQMAAARKGRLSGCLLGVGGGCFLSMFILMLFPALMMWGLMKAVTSGEITQMTTSTAPKVSLKTLSDEGKIPVVRLELRGAITGDWTSYWYNEPTCDAAVLEQIRKYTEDDAVQGLLLVVNSPGGSVTASDNLYHALECFKAAQEGRKIFVLGGDVVASGAYYLAMQADWIRVQPTSVVGSIGVIIPGMNLAGLANRLGIADNSIASGASKDLGNPLKPIDPAHNAVLKTVVDGMYERFVTLVAKGRKMQVQDVKKLADGRVYTATDAQNLRLVDDIGYEDTVVAKLAELYNCAEEDIYLYEPNVANDSFTAFFKLFPQAIGKGFAEALAPTQKEMPQYRW